MRTATTIEASAGKDAVEFAVEAERLGLDVCWVAEAWGADAPSPLGYLAARTETMLLGSGVIQVGTRSPVTIAQTAMTLAHLSCRRFLLGLVVSVPQVIEALHGVPFGHPRVRLRRTVTSTAAAWRAEASATLRPAGQGTRGTDRREPVRSNKRWCWTPLCAAPRTGYLAIRGPRARWGWTRSGFTRGATPCRP